MNKKFSTLMASVLLTSAFSVNAANPPVEGDYVRLKFNNDSEFLQISSRGELETDEKAATSGENYKNVFAGINSQLWKIAKVTKNATTGIPTYQFINKQTGEYLAIKLRTDTKDFVTEDKAELNPAGNKEWAMAKLSDGHTYLYAYDAKQDSTFFLTSGLELQSKKGSVNPEGAWVEIAGISDEYMPLNAAAFNALMKLTGNDGKLHFNNKKDVSADEVNILKNTKWEAKQFDGYNNAFALTDGSKKKGYADDMSYVDDTESKGYKKIDKLNYLMVDTTFYDKSGMYHKLVKDTVPYEWDNSDYFSGYKKNKNTRSANAAKMTGVYYIANDSIVLKASYVPKKAVATNGADKVAEYTWSEGNSSSSTTGSLNLSSYFTNARTAAGIDALKAAVDALKGEVNTFFSTGYKTNPVFTASANAQVESKMFADNSSLTNYLALVNGLKFVAGVPGTVDNQTYRTVDEIVAGLNAIEENTLTKDNAKTVKKAFVNWVNAYKAGTVTSSFANTNFSVDGNVAEQTGAGIYTGLGYLGSTLSGVNAETNETYLAIGAAINTLTGSVAAHFTYGEANTELAMNGDRTNLTAPTINYTNEDKIIAAIAKLEAQEYVWSLANPITSIAPSKFAETKFSDDNKIDAGGVMPDLSAFENATAGDLTTLNNVLSSVQFVYNAGTEEKLTDIYYNDADVDYVESKDGQIVLRNLSSATVLTVLNDGAITDADKSNGYMLPLIQPYATTGGDAKIATSNYHFIQVKNEAKMPTLRAADEAKLTNKYYVVDWTSGEDAYIVASSEVSEFNPFTQWAFVETSTGAYSIINRATERVLYTGPLFKVADAENTYTNGTDTLKIAAVTLPESTIITEGDKKYDVAGAFYPGKDESLIKRLFTINPVSPFMSQLAVQFNKDSVMILGDAADAPVWQLEEVEDSKDTYGYTIEGTAPLLAADYHIYTKDRDDNVYYVTLNEDEDGYILTKSDSKLGDDPSAFSFIQVAENQYLIVDEQKMTINPTPAKPILEASDPTSERNDLFTFTQVNQNLYRTLTAEDGVLGNAKIYMENEPNRYLYENTANIVANNGTGYNFLGIYNTAELTKNAALYVDTAYVNREDNLMPQYMFALGVETVDAKDAVACTYEHNHYDNAGNKVDAEHCSHATPATMGYKTGRYLVALTDSVPTTTKVHPTLYDGAIRLAFVPAIHRNAEDSLIIKNSKYTGNSKQQVAGKETTWAAKDTMKIADQSLNPATFALLIKDQATKSFYLENKEGYVRILNGVPVLTNDPKDAAVFNIEATTEEATANEAIAAEGVQVIAGKGTVTVQGAAGKVITVANILGQTIANQVAASDNVTIAAPAGIVVVAVEGEATKVVVK